MLWVKEILLWKSTLHLLYLNYPWNNANTVISLKESCNSWKNTLIRTPHQCKKQWLVSKATNEILYVQRTILAMSQDYSGNGLWVTPFWDSTAKQIKKWILRGQLLETYLFSSEESRPGSPVGRAGRSCRRRTRHPKEVNFAPERCDGRPWTERRCKLNSWTYLTVINTTDSPSVL